MNHLSTFVHTVDPSPAQDAFSQVLPPSDPNLAGPCSKFSDYHLLYQIYKRLGTLLCIFIEISVSQPWQGSHDAVITCSPVSFLGRITLNFPDQLSRH